MKYYYAVSGIFQLKKTEMTGAVRKYITSCSQKKIHIPAEIFSSEHVFLWGIGAFAENLLYAGYFKSAKDLHLLDVDQSKQGGKRRTFRCRNRNMFRKACFRYGHAV